MFHGTERHRRHRKGSHRTTSRGNVSRKRTVHPMVKVIRKSDRDRMVFQYLSALDSPRALTVWLLYCAGPEGHKHLLELTTDPIHYSNADAFRRDWAATKFLSKCELLTPGIDTDAAAVGSALKAEAQARETNRRFEAYATGALACSPEEGAMLYRAIRKIADILGPVPPFWFQTSPASDIHSGKEMSAFRGELVSDVFRPPGWSTGRTTSASGTSLSSVHKYGSRPDCTVSALTLAAQMVRDSHQWTNALLDGGFDVSLKTHIVDGNVMLIVPKNAKTGRVICYEPHMNVYLQLSVGDFIRSRLLKAGVNLNDQSINQRRAKVGSKFGHLATIDLRSASDTISRELVAQLLPLEWWHLLNQLRSRHTTWPGGRVSTNEKFSSMGNGFTFELESLIFYAVASAVAENVSVYGDDIIVPTESCSGVIHALTFCGFEVNTAKSFSTSLFRESCGADVFGGFDCTPFYLRRLKTLSDVVHFHNGVRRWAYAGVHTPEFVHLLAEWRDVFPCLLGPCGYGDGHYHVSFDEAVPLRPRNGEEGWWFHSYVQVYPNVVWGSDRPGTFQEALRAAAFCAATGPKRPRSIWSVGADRRKREHRRTRILARYTWRGDLWLI